MPSKVSLFLVFFVLMLTAQPVLAHSSPNPVKRLVNRLLEVTPLQLNTHLIPDLQQSQVTTFRKKSPEELLRMLKGLDLDPQGSRDLILNLETKFLGDVQKSMQNTGDDLPVGYLQKAFNDAYRGLLMQELFRSSKLDQQALNRLYTRARKKILDPAAPYEMRSNCFRAISGTRHFEKTVATLIATLRNSRKAEEARVNAAQGLGMALDELFIENHSNQHLGVEIIEEFLTLLARGAPKPVLRTSLENIYRPYRLVTSPRIWTKGENHFVPRHKVVFALKEFLGKEIDPELRDTARFALILSKRD